MNDLNDEADVTPLVEKKTGLANIDLNAQPSSAPCIYDHIGAASDAIVAMKVLNLGYIVIRTAETLDGPEARMSVFTDGEVSNFGN